MRTSGERLRTGLLVGAALVLAAVSGFLLMAHWRAHRLLHDLPGRLGAEIEKETNGYTYSQSLGGRTVFTIHAATATQRKDGQTLLHDVGIVLYGKTGRTNRIYGRDFTYDQKTGVVRAMGQVELDLEAPEPETARDRAAYAAGGPVRSDGGGQAVHVVTSGLVYVQKLGVASTPDPIRFTFRGVSGQAVGAAFSADSGMTVLERDVRVTATEQGRPATLTAQHAELARLTHTMQLRDARYSTTAPHRAPGETGERAVTAATMQVRLSEEGEVQEVVGTGGVEVRDGSSEARSPDGRLEYAADGRPARAEMSGGVRLKRTTEKGTVLGEAATAQVNFASGVASTIDLSGGARLREQTVAGADQSLAAKAMVIRLNDGRLNRLDATGDAVASGAGAGGAREDVRARHLVALFGVSDARSVVLRQITGDGGTEVHRVAKGVDETSRGETLEARFVPQAAAGGRRGVAPATEFGGVVLATAVQKGGVSVDRLTAAPTPMGRNTGKDAGAPDRLTATASELAYDGATGREVLRGTVQIEDGSSALRADVVEGDRASGDAVAAGNVLVTYAQAAAGGAPTAEPVHVRGARALVHHASQTADFFGGAGSGELARVWQGGSQVEAPVVSVDRRRQQMDARGAAGDVLPVHVVLVNESTAKDGGERPGSSGIRAPGNKDVLGQKTGVTRVRSGLLHYDGVTRQALFTGGVVVQDGESVLHSQAALAQLRPAPADSAQKAGAAGAAFGAGGLESLTATGDVTVQQPPGRIAHGTKAVYSAEDGTVVLTGTPGAPPRAEDAVNGSVSGASLRFRAGDNSVMVEGRSRADETVSGDGRVHTRTRVRPPQ